jgi:hypothetical protein
MRNIFFIKNESINDSTLYKRPGKIISCCSVLNKKESPVNIVARVFYFKNIRRAVGEGPAGLGCCLENRLSATADQEFESLSLRKKFKAKYMRVLVLK